MQKKEKKIVQIRVVTAVCDFIYLLVGWGRLVVPPRILYELRKEIKIFILVLKTNIKRV